MKKRVSLLLACCMLLSMAPVALADADIQIEDGAALELPQGGEGLEVVEDGAPALELDLDALELDGLDPDALELDALDEPSAPAEEAPAENATRQNAGESIPIQTMYFPDANFRKYVSEHFDSNHDGALSEKERKAVKKIEVNQQNISNLGGVDLFPELEELSCYGNQLTMLDVSACKELEKLSCYGNKLTKLNVGKCKELESLTCFGNQLTELDVSGCKELESLECHNNRLTELDVSACKDLKKLNCFDNKLTSLIMRECKKLNSLLCEKNKLSVLDLTDNANLIHAMKRGSDISATLGYTNVKCMESGKGRISFDDTTTIMVEGEAIYHKEGTKIERISLKKCKVLPIKNQLYSSGGAKPSPVVKYGDMTLRQDIDFTVSYSDNKTVGIGKATIKGKGMFTDEVTATFRIYPRTVKLMSLTAGKGYFTAKWQKGIDGVGYQLQYSMNKDFKDSKSVTIPSTKKLVQTVKQLKSGKTYYVRIRTFMKKLNTVFISPWSDAMSVKVK